MPKGVELSGRVDYSLGVWGNALRYVLRALGTNDAVEIGAAEYAEVVRAKNALVAMIGIEQKFDLVFENYADYERELLELSLRGLGSPHPLARHSRKLGGTASRARAVWSQTAEFSKTARSAALRGGLIEGHTGGRQTRMPIVRN